MTPRRLVVFGVILAALVVGALAFTMGLPGAVRPEPAPTASAAPAPAPSQVPSGEGDPGSLLHDGLTVAPGTRLVEAPAVKSSGAVSGWFANLDLTGEPAGVVEEYRSQLEGQGYQVVRSEVLSEGALAGTFSLEAHRMGSLPDASAPAPVDVVRLDVVPTGAVPGYVRFVVTHLEG